VWDFGRPAKSSISPTLPGEGGTGGGGRPSLELTFALVLPDERAKPRFDPLGNFPGWSPQPLHVVPSQREFSSSLERVSVWQNVIRVLSQTYDKST
jgi:hypothetical protein